MTTTMDIVFEALAERHRKDIIDILNYYIACTTAAYREKAVDFAHFDNFLNKENVHIGYAIENDKNEVIGFCTLEPFKSFAPFKATAEAMYFIKRGYTGKGVGSRALARLENDARRLGIRKLVVDIADDNETSISFHKNKGFKEYGRLHRCWRKFGKDLGIVYMEKEINSLENMAGEAEQPRNLPERIENLEREGAAARKL